MPFKREKYPAHWREFSARIRHERAGDRCERCGAPNGVEVARGKSAGRDWYMLDDGSTFDAVTGERLGDQRGSEAAAYVTGYVKVVLTVAHLDALGDVCRCEAAGGLKCALDEHVLALCQRCHLTYDGERHAFNARRTRADRAGQLWLGDIEHRHAKG